MKSSAQKAFSRILLLCGIMAGLLFFQGGGVPVKAGNDEVYEHLEILAEVLRQIEENYVEPQDTRELIYDAIRGMVEDLDPHSSFMTKEEHKDLMIQTKGSFTGVGIEITIRERAITVVSPIEGTPAYKAGLKAGDKVIKIDGEDATEMNLTDAVKRIRGPKGTEVELTVSREGAEKPLVFTITRDVIPLKSVRAYRLSADVGYIRISNFQSKTEEDLEKALEELEEAGLNGLVLDMRNNPGGLLNQAVKVADMFLDSGMIVSTRGRDESQNMEIFARENGRERNYPIVVLVNEGSASASEIVAGALQDNMRALILGTKTFGKGSVQTILPLSDGSGLRLTTARYYTPNGDSIQLKGIRPDIEMPFIPPDKDNDKEGEAIEPHFFREEDLKGHMMNGEVVEEPDEEEVSLEEAAERLLKRDNQVRHAMQLLETWDVFTRIKTGS
ncbi:MAG: S41 family peptidase [Desulfobacteraceae bacterium]